METFPFEQTACCFLSALASLCRQLGACAIYSRCFQARLAICFGILQRHTLQISPLFALT